jgi:hypothetical protein
VVRTSVSRAGATARVSLPRKWRRAFDTKGQPNRETLDLFSPKAMLESEPKRGRNRHSEGNSPRRGAGPAVAAPRSPQRSTSAERVACVEVGDSHGDSKMVVGRRHGFVVPSLVAQGAASVLFGVLAAGWVFVFELPLQYWWAPTALKQLLWALCVGGVLLLPRARRLAEAAVSPSNKVDHDAALELLYVGQPFLLGMMAQAWGGVEPIRAPDAAVLLRSLGATVVLAFALPTLTYLAACLSGKRGLGMGSAGRHEGYFTGVFTLFFACFLLRSIELLWGMRGAARFWDFWPPMLVIFMAIPAALKVLYWLCAVFRWALRIFSAVVDAIYWFLSFLADMPHEEEHKQPNCMVPAE